VLFKQNDLDQQDWSESLPRLLEKQTPVFDFYIEVSSDEEVAKELLADRKMRQTLFSENKIYIKQQSQPIVMIAQPFHDYVGRLDPQKEPVGYFLMWRKASANNVHLNVGLKNNILFALVAFVLFEIILYLGIIGMTRQFERKLQAQAAKLTDSNWQLAQCDTVLSHSLNDLKATQAQLIELKKKASLAGIVAGVAHEINTPVGISVTAASHLIERIGDIRHRFSRGEMTRDDLEKFLNNSDKACQILLTNLQRSADFVNSFKQVAVDQSSLQLRRFNLYAYLLEIKQSLQPRLKKTPHQLEINCQTSLELNTCPGVLSQVITNLVLNSITHGFDNHQEHQGMMRIDVALINNSTIRLDYRDDGKGIAEDHLNNIFKPFFTTNREAGGSGLGLNLVYNAITSNLGGTILVESKLGEGVHFIIEFPRVYATDEVMDD
jgi:signal transduction histidine kinase